MAQTPPNKAAAPDPSDPLFTLKHAQAEAELEAKNGLGPTSNEYVSTDEDEEISDAEGPRDSQGQRRGETNPTDEGSTAGNH